MTTYAKVQLSGSTNGKNIKLAATADAGDTVHTAHATALDEIWLYGMNSDTISHKLTIQFGATGTVSDLIEVGLDPEAGPVLVVPGLLLTNSLVVKAFADATNVVLVNGFVNRIT